VPFGSGLQAASGPVVVHEVYQRFTSVTHAELAWPPRRTAALQRRHSPSPVMNVFRRDVCPWRLRTRPLPVTHVQVGNCRSLRQVTARQAARDKTETDFAIHYIADLRSGGRRHVSHRAGTTYAACTAASAIARRSNSKTCARRQKPCRSARGCPPPGSVMVVRSDPLPVRGQPRFNA